MQTAASPALEKSHILIVEDETIVARDLKFILEDLGYIVPGIAASKEEALAIAANHHLDLVLMDIRIRGLPDGIQTAEDLKQRYRMGVVYVTAHTDDTTLKRAQATAPLAYIAKPLTATGVKVTLAIALERQYLQFEAEDREEWLHSALHSTGDAIVMSDMDGKVSFLNAAAEGLTGFSNESASGLDLHNVLRIQSEEGSRQRMQNRSALTESGKPRFLTATLSRAGGGTCPVLVSTAPFKKASGAGFGMVSVVRDISQLQKGEQDLRSKAASLTHSNDGLTLLTNSLMHDIGEPLRNISYYSNLIAAGQDNPLTREAELCLSGIDDQCKRLVSLISSMREYARAGTFERSTDELIDADGPLREALLNLHASIENSKATIELTPLPLVWAHPTALMLIFQNLLANAVQYSGQHAPRIHVASVRMGASWLFTISDNGIGFDPEQAGQVFGLFKEAHGDYSGSGMGLAICKRLVEQQGGRIWAESSLTGGARFHFTLPAERTAPSATNSLKPVPA